MTGKQSVEGLTIRFSDLDNPALVSIVSSPAFVSYFVMRAHVTHTKDGFLACCLSRLRLAQSLGGCSSRKISADIKLLEGFRLVRTLHTGRDSVYVLGEWKRSGRTKIDTYYLDSLLAGDLDKLPTANMRPGYIYVIRAVDYYKIGKETRQLSRVRDHQIASPFDIEVVIHEPVADCDSAESALHSMYATKRVRGEWFLLDGADINAIKNYLAEVA